ncbi:hypothetical protein [Natranaerofaba carboxydovora]|uniref:hypothetical protein n=1 Tax=Natranaerofaba carboxydovora TaxID=2742683 RepID=UPI001F135730|nr:hypothetical protein [Natranaerofaba carboxydovora]UMZ73016.1 hypothetical protein ACONDI_00560 [Natranaerofaba carboxydovora]
MMISRSEIKVDRTVRLNSSVLCQGNQIKWFKDNNWIKANTFGYEDTAEVLASKLLDCSNIDKSNFNYVRYNFVDIIEDNKTKYTGCSSENFLGKNEEHKTFYKLFEENLIDIDSLLTRKSVKEQIEIVSEIIFDVTGLKDIDTYIKYILALDAVILNEDRHFNNLSVIYNTELETYHLAPIFDNGLSLLSDTKGFPIDYTTRHLLNKVKSKPFSTSFKKQFKAVSNCGLKFNKDLIEELLSQFPLCRALNVLKFQLRKYETLVV